MDTNNVFEEERKRFKALDKWVYLDHPTYGLIPQYSLDRMVPYLERRNSEGVSVTEFWNTWNHADDLRRDIAEMIGCDGTEVLYGQSSTQLFNIIANGIALEPGDNIVTTDSVYPADAYVWLNKEAQGIELRYAETGTEGISPEELMNYTDGHTKAVALCMVENKTGWCHDMKRIGELCHQRNILLIADVTQCINVKKINVREMNIDFLTTSIYKWMMGAQGLGFGYIRKELLPLLSQNVCGWVGSVDRSHNNAKQLKLSSDAKRFELGGISFSALLGMEAVVKRYLELGGGAVEERVQTLVQHVYDRAKRDLKKIKLNAELPRENRSGIVIFKIPEGMKITDEMLAARGIRARVMNGTVIRTGFHYINNLNDADRLIDALAEIENEN